MLITRLELNKASTENGGYRNTQVAMARKLTGKKNHAISALIGMEIPEDDWQKFCLLGQKTKKKSIKEWKKAKRKEQSAAAHKKFDTAKKVNFEFFTSSEWLRLRMTALEKYGANCMICGRNYKEDKVRIHVDHIKPRSKYPQLALSIDNLQILCQDCNLGKGNRYETDYRPDAAQ